MLLGQRMSKSMSRAVGWEDRIAMRARGPSRWEAGKGLLEGSQLAGQGAVKLALNGRFSKKNHANVQGGLATCTTPVAGYRRLS